MLPEVSSGSGSGSDSSWRHRVGDGAGEGEGVWAVHTSSLVHEREQKNQPFQQQRTHETLGRKLNLVGLQISTFISEDDQLF